MTVYAIIRAFDEAITLYQEWKTMVLPNALFESDNENATLAGMLLCLCALAGADSDP